MVEKEHVSMVSSIVMGVVVGGEVEGLEGSGMRIVEREIERD